MKFFLITTINDMKNIILAGITCLLLCANCVVAKDFKPINQDYTMKQSRVYEREACLLLGENTTIKELRIKAFANVKQQVVEDHNTYLKSITRVINGEAVSNDVNAISEAHVKVLERKDFGLISNKCYRVWIRAEILSNTKNDPIMNIQPGTQLSVEMWTKNQKKSYGKNERFTILLKGNMDFYAFVANVRPDGDLTLLLPNKYRKNNHFKANKVYQIPGKEDIFKLTVGEPFGEEQMIIYASVAPLDGRLFTSSNKIFYEYKGNRTELSQKVRAINVELDEGKDFCEGELVIRTHQ
jgi:hypothetical protein